MGDSEPASEESESEEAEEWDMPLAEYIKPVHVPEFKKLEERFRELFPMWPPVTVDAYLDGLRNGSAQVQGDMVGSLAPQLGASGPKEVDALLRLLRSAQAKMRGEDILRLHRDFTTYFARSHRPVLVALDNEDVIVASESSSSGISVRAELLPLDNIEGEAALRRSITLPDEVACPKGAALWTGGAHGLLHLFVASDGVLSVFEVHPDKEVRESCRVEMRSCLRLPSKQLLVVEDELIVMLNSQSKMMLHAYDLRALLAAGGSRSAPSVPPPPSRRLIRQAKERSKPKETVHQPEGFSASNGIVYVADTGHCRIARYQLGSGQYLGAWGTGQGFAATEFQNPHACAVLGDRLYVAEDRKIKALRLHDGTPIGEYRMPSHVCLSVIAGRDRLLVVSLSIKSSRHRLFSLQPQAAEALEGALQAARGAPCLLGVDSIGLHAAASAAEELEGAGAKLGEQLQAARNLLQGAKECQRLAKEGIECDFFFLAASKLCEPATAQMVTLPRFQQLQAVGGWLVRRRCTFAGACVGEYANEYLAVSHVCCQL